MTYATPDDLAALAGMDELVSLTDRADPPTGEADAGLIARALAAAGAEIDGFLGTRYALPLTMVPELVRGWAVDIARYRLWGAERRPEHVREAYEDAIARLRQVAAGTITLDTGAAPAPAPGGGVKAHHRPTVFADGGLVSAGFFGPGGGSW